MNTVVTYQSFGYGPVMKVIKFLAEINGGLGAGATLIAAQKDKHVLAPNEHLLMGVSVIYVSSSVEKIAALGRLEPISTIISFNDYESIVWGYFQKVPVRIAVDGLFHLWLIGEQDFLNQKQAFEHNRRQSFSYMQKQAARLFEYAPHDAIIWKHYFATHSFMGNYRGVHEKVAAFQKYDLINVVGYFDFMPLPERVVQLVSTKEPKTLLINFGGGRYPTMTLDEEKRYCELAVKAIKEYQAVLDARFEFSEKIVLVHPDLLAHVEMLIDDDSYTFTASPSMVEYTKILMRAAAVIAAPGNTAVFEATHQGKIVCLLPEKHIEQINFVNLVKDSFINASTFEYVPDKQYATSSEQGSVEMLMAAVGKVMQSTDIKLVSQPAVKRALDHELTWIDGQKSCLASMYGPGNGTQQLIQGVAEIIEQGTYVIPKRLHVMHDGRTSVRLKEEVVL